MWLGCIDIPQHQQCNEAVELGRVRALGLITTSFYQQLVQDAENANYWLAGIQAQQIFIAQCNGQFNGGNPVTVRGFGYVEEKFSHYNFELEIRDAAFYDNGDFYDAITGARYFHVAFISQSVLYISQVPALLLPTLPIISNNKSEVVYNLMAKWTTNRLPLKFAIPPDVFVVNPVLPTCVSGFDQSFDESFDICNP
jgi:hypothetical protein